MLPAYGTAVVTIPFPEPMSTGKRKRRSCMTITLPITSGPTTDASIDVVRQGGVVVKYCHRMIHSFDGRPLDVDQQWLILGNNNS